MDLGIHGFTDFLLFVLVAGFALEALLGGIGRGIAALVRCAKPIRVAGYEIRPLDIFVIVGSAAVFIIPLIVGAWLRR